MNADTNPSGSLPSTPLRAEASAPNSVYGWLCGFGFTPLVSDHTGGDFVS